MTAKLTQKERMLLEDQKKHEEVCIQKYKAYADQTQSTQLKQLFQSYAQQEQQHYDSLSQILNGQVPSTNSQSQQQSQANTQTSAGAAGAVNNPVDAAICNDMLMTEKYVSGAYDTAIFEFTDSNTRQVLNHIQQEEQKHGEGIFQYMQSAGMYQTQ